MPWDQTPRMGMEGVRVMAADVDSLCLFVLREVAVKWYKSSDSADRESRHRLSAALRGMEATEPAPVPLSSTLHLRHLGNCHLLCVSIGIGYLVQSMPESDSWLVQAPR